MSKKQESCGSFKTMCGGQALIEGIMMRGPAKQAIVVRRPDGGMEIKEEALELVKDKHPILGVPFIRGTVNFLDSMVKGVKALMFSADFYPDDETEGEPSKFDAFLEKHLGSEKAMSAVITLAVAMGLLFSVGLFFVLPTLLTNLVAPLIKNHLLLNLVEGGVRILIFLTYLILCSRMKDIKRVFAYHGAEHKTIFCYERGLPLTVENVRKMPRHHPRCGTSFLFVIMIVSILVYALLGFTGVNPILKMAIRLLLLPVIVGITYEINRFVGRHDNWFTRIITAPGLWLQNWTTNEPDDTMIEVGIKALELVLPEEKGKDQW
ncbi:MAG: DUF1385 domain-containing protein [Oscillospiraceae bacterium]